MPGEWPLHIRIYLSLYFKSDVILRCNEVQYEMHRAFIVKSETLKDLVAAAEQRSSRNDNKTVTINLKIEDEKITQQGRCCVCEESDKQYERARYNMCLISDIAVALANLYYDRVVVEQSRLVPVMQIAFILKFQILLEG